jgi:hypothetical protein
MIVFSVGPLGPLAAWCDAAIARIVETGIGPVAVMGADTPDDVAASLIRSTAPHLVIASRHPSEQLRRMLAEAGGSVIVALDLPVRALHELVVGYGNDPLNAVRVVADSYAAALVCAGFPTAAVIAADHPRTDPGTVADIIAGCCGLPGQGGQAGLPPLSDNAALVDAWWAALDPADRAVAEGALGAYAGWLRGEGLGQIVWDRRLFCRASDPASHAGVAIDIGDTPAPLVLGPWIGLPPGNWAASVTIAVSKETDGTAFDIAMYGGAESVLLARASIVPDGRRFGSATLLFTVAPASGQTISFVISNTVPAPGGRLAMGNVVLTPSPAEGSGVPAELTTALSL